VAFCAAPVAGQIASLAWLRHRLPRTMRARAPARADDVKRLLRALGPFAAAFIALTVHYKVGVLLLAHWRSAEDVGIYTAAAKFIDMFQALTIVAIAAVYPRLARASGRVLEGGRWAGTRMTEIVLLCAVPVGALLWLSRTPVVHVVYGDAFATAVPVVARLALMIPPLAIDLLGGYVLAVTGGMLQVAALYAGGLTLNATLCALLIPERGAPGAALALLVSETAVAAGMLIVLRARAAAAPALRPVLLALAAAAAGGVASVLAGGRAGIAVAAAYGGVVCALYGVGGALTGAERAAIGLAWRRTWHGARRAA
jgi:O-antigen/teichoic acid export membrane protein